MSEFGEDLAKILVGAFPTLFFLGRSPSTLSQKYVTHYLNFYDNRFAQSSRFLFYLFNVRQRHQVLKSMSLYVKNHPETISKFSDVISSPNFIHEVNAAMQDHPQGRQARKVMSQVSPFLKAVGSKVPYGPLERNSSMGKLISMVYRFSIPSWFITISPDEVSERGVMREIIEKLLRKIAYERNY